MYEWRKIYPFFNKQTRRNIPKNVYTEIILRIEIWMNFETLPNIKEHSVSE